MKYSLRFVWYILRIVIVAASAFAILAAAFFIAMDSANVFVIVTDGMKARATSALLPSQSTDLARFFTDSFLKNQPPVDTSKYAAFTITGIDYKLNVESLWCRPWQNTATVTVVESIPEMYYDIPMNAEEGKDIPVPPPWQRARYKIQCVRTADAWRIDKIELVKALAPEPTPTPEPTGYVTASPQPTASASPAASVEAGSSESPSATE